VSNKKIENLIFNAVEEINNQLPDEKQLIKSTKTTLFGREGNLDSLGLVNLVVTIEQNIEDEFDVRITIADERAMSQKHSPFRTIGTLADYINMLLKRDIILFQPNTHQL
jgi:D-alanine--poly(phosphoribitol) ligase subunit 2